jgi:histidine triad (HIT) family protein
MASIFSKIVKGEVPAHIVAETDHYLAFLDIMPLHPGHTLVIPKDEVDYILDLDDELYMGLWLFAKHVAKAIEKAIPCERIGFAVVGLEVPHAHIHVIPIHSVEDISFNKPRSRASDEELAKIAESIRQFL